MERKLKQSTPLLPRSMTRALRAFLYNPSLFFLFYLIIIIIVTKLCLNKLTSASKSFQRTKQITITSSQDIKDPKNKLPSHHLYTIPTREEKRKHVSTKQPAVASSSSSSRASSKLSRAAQAPLPPPSHRDLHLEGCQDLVRVHVSFPFLFPTTSLSFFFQSFFVFLFFFSLVHIQLSTK